MKQAGGLFTIATGRTVQASRRYPEELGLKTPMIVFNGAGIYDYQMDELLFRHPLPDTAKEMTRQILRDNPHAGVEILCAEDTWVVNNTEWEQEHVKVCGHAAVRHDPKEVQGTWLKVLFAMDPEDIPRIYGLYGQQGFAGVDFIRPRSVSMRCSRTAFQGQRTHGIPDAAGDGGLHIRGGRRL